jgi:hypothetical protein
MELMEWSALVLTLRDDRGRRISPWKISTIGIDIGKSCFHVVGFDASPEATIRFTQRADTFTRTILHR